ncbi:MAG TPA: response regulator transcription factor [Bryobacteraceae bacterium]|jgi:DNA-binding response OmpR family regulator
MPTPPVALEDPAAHQPAELGTFDHDSQVSIVNLLEQLESALKDAPIDTRDKASEGLKELADFAGAAAVTPMEVLATIPAPAAVTVASPAPPPAAPTKERKTLEGIKVAAIGFGRQDIAGLATAMIEHRARIEFLPRGVVENLAEFDLIVLNGSSTESLKREAPGFRAVLESGIPAIVMGSRATLNLLRDMGDPRTWDFIAKPIHMEELIWRSANLLSRHEEAGIGRPMPARVVIADHDPFTRMLVESTLSQSGVICDVAEEGDVAWTAIEKSQPGAVILDLTLPNRDGFQLMADIRRAPGRKPKVIVLSARQSEADILRAFALGADDYVTKPFSPLELSARLMRLLGSKPDHA